MTKPQTKPKLARKVLNGWVNVNKPVGMGSTDVVRALKRALSPEKIGHAGTLDPLANGVLPIALGEATKTVAYMMEAKKTYRFSLQFGTATSTDDAEGVVVERSETRPTATAIEAALPQFTGNIWQVPPKYSAIKVDGARAYDLARAGEEVTLAERLVYIEALQLLGTAGDEAHFEVTCGKGMYVRSLARDLAKTLGSCAYITALCRTKVGNFTLENAISLDFFENPAYLNGQDTFLRPVTEALVDIPALCVTEAEAARLRSGLPITMVSKQNLERLHTAMNAVDPFGGTLVCLTQSGTAVAMAKVQGVDVRPDRVFNL